MQGISPRYHRLLICGTRYSAIPIVLIARVHDVYIAKGNMNEEVCQTRAGLTSPNSHTTQWHQPSLYCDDNG